MATLLFVILRLTKVIALEYPASDLLTMLQLLALDTISAMILIHALLMRKAKKT